MHFIRIGAMSNMTEICVIDIILKSFKVPSAIYLGCRRIGVRTYKRINVRTYGNTNVLPYILIGLDGYLLGCPRPVPWTILLRTMVDATGPRAAVGQGSLHRLPPPLPMGGWANAHWRMAFTQSLMGEASGLQDRALPGKPQCGPSHTAHYGRQAAAEDYGREDERHTRLAEHYPIH